ncbi:MAG: DsbA family protein [Nitrososphaerales archaeon]
MKSIEFYFDFASPNCYVALPKLKEMCAKRGARVTYCPMLLGGIFKATSDAPVARESHEYEYMAKNLGRISKKLGIPFNPPHERFPINSLRAIRGYYFAESHGKIEEYVPKIFEACWGLDCDISDPQNLKSIVDSLGLDYTNFLSFIELEETKQRLKKDTQDAYERGVFGAPTYFIDGDMYWGTPEILWYIDATI